MILIVRRRTKMSVFGHFSFTGIIQIIDNQDITPIGISFEY
jgi:hypothetical protein